jgi:hypothetical protein
VEVGFLATIENIVRELDDLFVIFNFKFFGGDLIKPVLAVQTNQFHRGATMGWCTSRKVWRQADLGEEYYEITVCPEFFDLGIVELADTLLHELVHLFHLQNEIQDVSRGGYYHNAAFRDKALECGMEVLQTPKYGWAFTILSDETRTFVEGLLIDREAFRLTRKRLMQLQNPANGSSGASIDPNAGVAPPARQSYRKYVCPGCGMAVRATKDVRVKCGDCEIMMEKFAKS